MNPESLPSGSLKWALFQAGGGAACALGVIPPSDFWLVPFLASGSSLTQTGWVILNWVINGDPLPSSGALSLCSPLSLPPPPQYTTHVHHTADAQAVFQHLDIAHFSRQIPYILYSVPGMLTTTHSCLRLVAAVSGTPTSLLQPQSKLSLLCSLANTVFFSFRVLLMGLVISISCQWTLIYTKAGTDMFSLPFSFQYLALNRHIVGIL